MDGVGGSGERGDGGGWEGRGRRHFGWCWWIGGGDCVVENGGVEVGD